MTSMGGFCGDDVIEVIQSLFPLGNGLVAMFVYSDLGDRDLDLLDKGSGNIICVSAVVFKPIKYKQFCREWSKFLKPWGATAFHATDFYGGANEFDWNRNPKLREMQIADSKRIPHMIGDKVERVLLVAIKPKEYLEKAPIGWLDLFGKSVHSIAMQVILLDLGWWRTDHIPTKKLAYFIERGDVDYGKVMETQENMRANPETGKVIGVSSFTSYEKNQQVRGIEAADFFSWHSNKYCVDYLLKGNPQEARKDFKAAVSASGNSVEQIFLTDKHLEYFFSRVPKELLERAANEKRTKE